MVLSVLSLCLLVIVERQIIDEIILMKISKHRTSVSCFTPKIEPLSFTHNEIQPFSLAIIVFVFKG